MGKMRLVAGLVLCWALSTLARVAQADGCCEWRRKYLLLDRKYHELESKCFELKRKHIDIESEKAYLEDEKARLESEVTEWRARYERDFIAPLHSPNELVRFQELRFRRTPLAEAVDVLNVGLSAVDAYAHAIAVAIERRQNRILELEADIERLRQFANTEPVTSIVFDFLDDSESVMQYPITFGAMNINLEDTIYVLTEICGISWEMSNGVIRLVPHVMHRPIPRDALSVAFITPMVEAMFAAADTPPIYYPRDHTLQATILFSQDGLQQAIEDGYANDVVQDEHVMGNWVCGCITTNTLHVCRLTDSGLERFRYLLRAGLPDKEKPVLVATSSCCSHTRAVFGSNLHGRYVPCDIRLLRATNEKRDGVKEWILRDYDTNEPVQPDMDWREVLRRKPAPANPLRPFGGVGAPRAESPAGVYVYYGLNVAGVRPEDLPYFVIAREYRLEKLHEHEGLYYLRFPERLRVIPKNVENDFGVP
jgi:hypothetical protein